MVGMKIIETNKCSNDLIRTSLTCHHHHHHHTHSHCDLPLNVILYSNTRNRTLM
ncbi:hypothetical protein I4U23_000486, partial [Adineta vaga]